SLAARGAPVQELVSEDRWAASSSDAVHVDLTEAAATPAVAVEWLDHTPNRPAQPRSLVIQAATACRSMTPPHSKRLWHESVSAIRCTSICPKDCSRGRSATSKWISQLRLPLALPMPQSDIAAGLSRRIAA